MGMVSSAPVVQQAIMIVMMSLFSRGLVCFSVCFRMRLRTLKINKILWESMAPHTPLE